MSRVDYWNEVVLILDEEWNIRKRSGTHLNWQTIEVLAESRGFLREHVAEPSVMAFRVKSWFQPFEI